MYEEQRHKQYTNEEEVFMVIKKLLKTGACFAAMALIVGMYISPSIARASYDK